MTSLRARKLHLMCGVVAGIASSSPSWAQQPDQAPAEGNRQVPTTPASESRAAEPHSPADDIVVTGSRFGGHTSTSSPVPVDVVTSEQLRAAGHTELAEAISATVPAFNFRPVAGGNVQSAVRQFTYRGLPPNEVLVLVNGKRSHPTAVSVNSTFDFNSIPPTTVGSVEVLRDGASAQYGSDAIGGVVNVRLRTDTRTEITSMIGQYYAGDGFTVETSFDTGMRIGDGGFVRLSAYYRDANGTNRQGPDRRQMYFARNAAGQLVNLGVVSAQTDLTPVVPAGFTLDPREATGVDRLRDGNLGNAARHEGGIWFNSELPLGGDVTAYAFGGFTRRDVDTPFLFRTPRDNSNVRAIHPDGYKPIYDARISDLQLTAGLRGTIGGWNWDLSQAYGFGYLRSYVHNSVNPSLGTASPTDFYAGSQRLSQATTNLDLRRDINIGLESPLRVALGSEFRHERIQTGKGELASYVNGLVPILDGPSAGTSAAIGSQGFGGTPPVDVVDKSRNSIAVYVDLESQVTRTLLLTAAGRYEHYSDFGSTANGKFAFRYEFAHPFALRGSISTGFRAPSLMETYYSRTSSGVLSGQFVTNRIFPVSDPVAQALGAQPLEPEKSVSYSLGLVANFGRHFSVTVDAYRTNVDNAIILSSAFSDAGSRAFLAARGLTGIGSAQFFTNAIDKRVDGVDLVADYRTSIGRDVNLTLSLGANYNNPQVRSVDPTPAALAAVTTIPLFNANSIVALEQLAPRTRVNLSAALDYRRLSFLVRETRYGSTREGSGGGTLDQTFDPKWITDVEVGFRISQSFEIRAGAQNLFNVYPEQYTNFFNPSGIQIYSPNGATFGASGGFYYLRTLVRF